jgi:hypothetical protein
VRSRVTEPLYQLAGAWRSATGPSRRRIATVCVALGWAVALLVARQGTVRARLGAAMLMGASAVVAVGWRVLEMRRLQQPGWIVRGLVRRVDKERADRALRALSLVGLDGEVRAEGTSQELARLHVARAIAQLPSEQIVESAAHTAARVGTVALVGAACLLAIAFAQAWSVLEGANVLFARRGVAPVTMQWLDDLEVLARPPDYLRQPERHALAFVSLLMPYGTLVTVRGVPVHVGRQLLLSDGIAEVPFVDDGAGAVVARWSLTRSASLHVVARFGGVAITGPEALVVESVPDRAPTVTLEGAPRQLLLVEQTSDDIPIKYEAVDDHGLREVHLVLRSGVREERRVLVRLDGETKTDRGGYVLKLRDPFLKNSHAAVEVTVEAKDNDPLTGPKWGVSPAITLVPPDVGEPEARRLDALHRLRDALVDSLAWRLAGPGPDGKSPALAWPSPKHGDAAGRKAFIAEEGRLADADDALLAQTLAQAYAGVRIAPRVRAPLVEAQQRTRKALDVETQAPSDASHASVVKATERFVLVADAVLRGLGLHDARDSARQLADVADDLALGASQLQSDPDGKSPAPAAASSKPDGTSPAPAGAWSKPDAARSRAALRMDVAMVVLSGGGQVMKRLGALGRDLGEIVEADLLRVKRAREATDFMHAELAARDLAARLREPDPSFGARGGGMGRAGGESGGARGTPGDPGDSPDDVDRAFEAAAREVEQLAQDHAGEIARMERALAGATSEEELEEVRREAKLHAEAIRDAARGLPSVGNGSDSWTSKGAAARELAEQMARSLERGAVPDALQSGRGALGFLDEAKKMLQKGSWIEDPSGQERRRVEDAHRGLEGEEKWVERELEKMRTRAAERARKELHEGGEEERKLADRARDVAQRGRERGSLPQPAVESIVDAERAARQAAESLMEGAAEKGLERQREAQRALEAANEQLHGDDEANEASHSESEGDDRRSAAASHGNVPLPGKHKGPEEFRKRVVRGLGQPASGALKEAVRRYAEGLLR